MGRLNYFVNELKIAYNLIINQHKQMECCNYLVNELIIAYNESG